MNKTLGLQLVIYSLLLVSLSYLTYYLVPVLAHTTLMTGLIGGTFCLILGLRTFAGITGKALTVLTLFLVNFMMVAQTVISWSSAIEGKPGHRTAASLITLLCVLSFGMMMKVIYAGAIFDGVKTANSIKQDGKNVRNHA